MAVSKIDIKKFTVFTDVTIEPSPGINIVIGENGTGKTHLLKLVYADMFVRTTCQNENSELRNVESVKTNNASTKDVLEFGNFHQYSHIDGDDPFAILWFTHRTQERICGGGILDGSYGSQPANLTAATDVYKSTIKSTKAFRPLYIPAKEVLSMSKIIRIYDDYSKSLSLDYTIIDIIKCTLKLKPNNPPALAEKIASKIEEIIGGEVLVKDDYSFWVKKHNNQEIPFNMESEGFRKLGLIWQLLMNGTINEDTVLLWDEPEANINPQLAPTVVEILLELARQGVQIFLATHDYKFAKLFEIRRREQDQVLFHSLYRDEKDSPVKHECNENFRDLKNNSIIHALDKLMVEVIEGNMGD